jgi:hypothetical protein
MFCLDKIKQIAPGQFKIDHILAGENPDDPDEEMMERKFYAQLGWSEACSLREKIDEEFYRVFPGLKPVPLPPLSNSIIDRIGRFLLG